MIFTGTKQIPDVSFYQAEINWDTMRSKTDAVIIRAGQGLNVDPQFVRNYTEAKNRQMLRGVYWFFDDRISPSSQAILLTSLIRNDLPEMEMWADWEKYYGGTYQGLKFPVQFMKAVEAELPTVSTGFYTGYYWMKDHSSLALNPGEYAYLRTRPLWLGNYNPVTQVLVPLPWTDIPGQPLWWQWGTPSWGLAYGVKSVEIDMNLVNLPDDQFYARYKKNGDTMPVAYQGTVITAGLNIRSSTDTTSTANVIGQLVLNDKVEASAVVNGWWTLTLKNGQPQTGYSYEGSTKGYIRLDAIVDAPAPPERTPFTLNVAGYKPFEGELEAENG